MNKKIKFFLLSLILFTIISGISFLQAFNFSLFEKLLNYIKTPSSWFIGLSLAYVFSNLFQKILTSIFLKRKEDKGKEEKRAEDDFFEGFLITLLITSFITPYLRDMVIYFFDNLLIYFHIILLQSVIVIYLLFKLKNNYEISGKYLVVSELIVLINTLFILYFVA